MVELGRIFCGPGSPPSGDLVSDLQAYGTEWDQPHFHVTSGSCGCIVWFRGTDWQQAMHRNFCPLRLRCPSAQTNPRGLDCAFTIGPFLWTVRQVLPAFFGLRSPPRAWKSIMHHACMALLCGQAATQSSSLWAACRRRRAPGPSVQGYPRRRLPCDPGLHRFATTA